MMHQMIEPIRSAYPGANYDEVCFHHSNGDWVVWVKHFAWGWFRGASMEEQRNNPNRDYYAARPYHGMVTEAETPPPQDSIWVKGEKAHPVGQAEVLPHVPYSGGWSGLSGFSRTIGYYSFGASVYGKLQPVRLLTASGWKLGGKAISEVRILCEHTNGWWRRAFSPGTIWVPHVNVLKQIDYFYIEDYNIDPEELDELVDSLGRW